MSVHVVVDFDLDKVGIAGISSLIHSVKERHSFKHSLISQGACQVSNDLGWWRELSVEC